MTTWRRVPTRSDFDWDDLQYGERPCSLYLLAPSPAVLSRLHPVYRVILDVATARLMEHPQHTFKHRLLTIADECAAYGYTAAIEKRITDKAGNGMHDLLIFQDLGQLWDTYGENTTIWSNTDVKVFFAPLSDKTAERISQMLGMQTIEEKLPQGRGHA